MKSVYNKNFLLRTTVSVVDWIAFNAALLICMVTGWWPHLAHPEVWVIANISYIIAHGYILITLHHRWASLATIMRNASRSALLIVVLSAAILGMNHMEVPGFFRSLTVMAVIFLVTVAERMTVNRLIKRMRYNGRNSIHAIIVGHCDLAGKVISVMNDRWNGYRLLGVFDDDAAKLKAVYGQQDGAAVSHGVNYLGRISDAMAWLENNSVNEVYVCLSDNEEHILKPLLRLCDHRMIRVYYIPLDISVVRRKTQMVEFGDTYVMAQYSEPLMNGMNRMRKRLFDIIVSSLFLCTLFPIICLVVTIITKITMPGPVFFKQKRTGYDGRDFSCYKFRSMKVNGESDTLQATKGDPRVTKWGRIMRHTNIDELPQFINVLRGDMSIVGPRPHMLAHTEYYGNEIGEYMIRHYVRPGITGWAQTHGERGETQTVADMARRVEKDIWYIEHWYFWLDIQIILKTVQDAVMGDKKAY